MDIEYIEDKKHSPCNWCVYSSTKTSEAAMCKRCEFWQLREVVERGITKIHHRYWIRGANCYNHSFKGNVTERVVRQAIDIHRMQTGKNPDKIIISSDLFAGLMELIQVTYNLGREVRECSFYGIPIAEMEGKGEIVICDNTEVALVPKEASE